jgi:hypothetical protein
MIRMHNRAVVLVGAGLLAISLSGCGSSSPDRAAAPAPSSSTAGTASAPASGGPQGIPSVSTNATDLTKQPVLAAGSGTPGTALATNDLLVGNGATTRAQDTVDVRYVGAIYSTGTVFDTSWGKPSSQPGVPEGAAEFPLSGVVPGFAQGIAGMKVGGRREIVIPPALGYGPKGQPDAGIKGTDTIVFVVDLVKVLSAP